MKKNIIFFIILFLSSGISAQNPVEKGNFVLNAGTGIGVYSVPIYIAADYGIGSDISLGVDLSFGFCFDSFKEKNDGRKTVFNSLAKVDYHFNNLLNISNKYDFYAGLSLGYGINTPDGFLVRTQIGGRYYFSETIAVNAQFFGGNFSSGIMIGVSYTIK